MIERPPSPDTFWAPELAKFLAEESSVAALKIDPKNKKVSIATLGPANTELLTERLQFIIKEIEHSIDNDEEREWSEEMKRVHVTPQDHHTVLEKPTCPTAPILWVWRDVEWQKPQEAHIHDHGDNWGFLLILAGSCGVFGISGYIAENFTTLPAWVPITSYILSMVAGGWEAATDVWHHIPKGEFDIHFLMLCVAVGATAIGAWREGALLLFLFSTSGGLEHFALSRTQNAIKSLFHAAPKTAIILEDDKEKEVDIDTVVAEQILLVKPGDMFPVDALIISGETAADESNLTGESAPIDKAKGDTVYSGTLNLWGSVEARVLRPAHASALQKIIKLIQEAQHLKAKSQRFTDKFGTPYTYGVLSATLILFLVAWLVLGLEPFTNTKEHYSAFYRAMTFLVVASPCALVLSIPSAILAAIARGARHGILFRGGAAIEKIAEVDTVALDKTGTLTTGNLQVSKVESFPVGHEDRIIELAYTLEQKANHPIARSIIQYGTSQNLTPLNVTQFKSLTGLGIEGNLEGSRCILGKKDLLELGALKPWAKDLPEPKEGYTEVWVMHKGLIGRILLRDTIRKESKPVLKALAAKNIKTLMLTGDHSSSAHKVANEIGISDVRSALSPKDKVNIISDLGRSGHKVAMIGDGVNDAPSLAAAYVSIAMGARGSDAAREQSEVVLMHDRIDNFLEAHEISTFARRIIRQNLFIALSTIFVMIASASLGLIPLSVGVFAHEGSTIIVCLNSLRLLLKKKSKKTLV